MASQISNGMATISLISRGNPQEAREHSNQFIHNQLVANIEIITMFFKSHSLSLSKRKNNLYKIFFLWPNPIK